MEKKDDPAKLPPVQKSVLVFLMHIFSPTGKSNQLAVPILNAKQLTCIAYHVQQLLNDSVKSLSMG